MDSGRAAGKGARVRGNGSARSIVRAPRCRVAEAAPAFGRTECLEQLLEAFADIADRDDIHQAAERLARIQEWITREAEAAAADPIFAALRLAS